MSNDDILQMWQQSPHKNTLGYYGVGSQVPKPEAVIFNRQITQSLQRANGLKQRRKQLQLQGPRTLPTIGGKKVAESAYKPYVLNREAIKAAIQKMPTVKKNLSPSQALTTVYCNKSDPVDPFGVTKEKQQQQQPELKMEHAPLKKTYGHRRPYPYCGWRCDEPKNKCTDYEWKKYKQDPRPCDEDLKREQKVAQEQTQVPEPRNYEELYLRLVKCFEALKVECPMCKAYAQCCNPRGLEGDAPGGKPGDGDKYGRKPGDGDKPGGKPGGGDKPGGKPGGLDKPGGKPGGGGKPWDRPAVGEEAPDDKGQAGEKPGSLHEDEKNEGEKGKLKHKPSESKLKTKQPDDPDAPDKAGEKDKGKSKRPKPSKPECDPNDPLCQPECDPDDPFCDTYSQDTPKQSINKRKGSKTSRPSEPACDPNDPLCSVKKDPGDSLTQPPGAPPIGPISQPTQGPEIPKQGIKDQGPPGGDGKTAKGKGPKGGPSKEEVKPEKANIPSCPCPICEFLRRHNEPDSPMIREMKRQDKLRQQREYYKQMCHRQYLECREPEYRAPQHRCDPIECDNTFCSNPKLGDYCECLKAMQDLQQMLGKNHKIVGNQLLFDLEDLRTRLCKQMCDCL
ncbi:GL19273 [Drosophila persimilis]|uniref:GL19273 n=1 Tax=Drosophila persimilis TaxID=7234 RepID=B4G8B8_DROPE|nr:GL19273 [Drosophila persimilis]